MGRPRKPKNTAPTKHIGEFSGHLVREPDIKNDTRFGDGHTVAYFELLGTDNGQGGNMLVKIDAFKDLSDELLTFHRGNFCRVFGFVTESVYMKNGLTYRGYCVIAKSFSRS